MNPENMNPEPNRRIIKAVCNEIGIKNPMFIMDNARIHHFKGFVAMTERRGITILYLKHYRNMFFQSGRIRLVQNVAAMKNSYGIQLIQL